jgi:hypothetical protein
MPAWEIPPANPSEVYLQRISDLEPEADKRITNQHVASKIILKGFAAPGRAGSGCQLTPFDLRLGHEQKARGLRGCGKVPDFLTFASESAELLWKTVEDQLDPAISAARAGRLHDHDAQVEAIKDAIALHLVRSHRYLQMHRTIIAQSIGFVRQDVLRSRTAMLGAEFQHRHGLLPAGPEALAAVLDEAIAKWRALDARGATVRVSMEAMFRRVRAALRAQTVEIWHIPQGHELLISDTPAFTFRYLAENTTIQPNVAIGDSHGIALPLARDCLAVIGPAAKDDDLTPDQVRLFNQVQVVIAHRHVYYRPGSGLGAFVRAML